MANAEHVAILKKGVDAWNAWRKENPDILPDLSAADLSGARLSRADLSEADLSGARLIRADLFQAELSQANLSRADLFQAELSRVSLSGADLNGAGLSRTNLKMADLSVAKLKGAHLRGADLFQAKLRGADLSEADLHGANLSKVDLSGADLHGANLSKVNLSGADLRGANLSEVDLSGADLGGANLRGANFSRRANLIDANLSGADLSEASLRGVYLSRADLRRTKLRDADLSEAYLNYALLVETDLTGADLTGSHIYGVSAWRLKLESTKQQNLVITDVNEPEITVDNIEVAQFIYLMLHNQKIHGVIDALTSQAVLILGRFTDERKAVLDALREELRKRNYLPILFDINVPETRDITEAVSLARMARFIIADLTDLSSIPKELEAVVLQLGVPVQPLLEASSRPYAMFTDYWKYDWVLPVYRYKGLEALRATFAEKVIEPAAAKVESVRIAKERKDAIFQTIVFPSKEYAVTFASGAVEQRAALNIADRTELQDLVEELSVEAAERESHGGAVAGHNGATLRGATKSNRVEIDYVIDEASRRIRIIAVQQRSAAPTSP
jgi:uncharacterized protein YjbI with pentapeptide repeats